MLSKNVHHVDVQSLIIHILHLFKKIMREELWMCQAINKNGE